MGWDLLMNAVSAGTGAVVGSLLVPYVMRKAKNLADKQDIGAIQASIEEVKSAFNRELEELKAFHQSRWIAAECRLQKHQEAYELSVKLMWKVHDEEGVLDEIVRDIQSWLLQNSLYLTPDAREALVDAWVAARFHKGLLANDHRNEEQSQRIIDNWNKIENAYKAIAAEVDLPSFSVSKSPIPDSKKLTATGERQG